MKQHKAQPAFSLIEILVVTSVVSLSFVAVLGLVKRAIELYYYNQNFLVATMLAQEGAETVRYLRDQNWVTNNNFYNYIASTSQTPQDGDPYIFALDYRALTDITKIKPFYYVGGNLLEGSTCNNDPVRLNCYIKESAAKVYVNTANHNYHSIWDPKDGAPPAGYQPTIFNRLVETTYHTNGTSSTLSDDFLLVTVKIFWQEKGREKTYVLNTYLFNYSWEYDNGN